MNYAHFFHLFSNKEVSEKNTIVKHCLHNPWELPVFLKTTCIFIVSWHKLLSGCSARCQNKHGSTSRSPSRDNFFRETAHAVDFVCVTVCSFRQRIDKGYSQAEKVNQSTIPITNMHNRGRESGKGEKKREREGKTEWGSKEKKRGRGVLKQEGETQWSKDVFP